MIGAMPAFGPTHVLMLAVTAVAAITAVQLTRRSTDPSRALRVCGLVLLAVSVFWMAWDLLPTHFDVSRSLPLHYSDALRIITSYALITGKRWAVAVSFYWGLTLNFLSILTPDVTYWHVPWLEFFMYWFLHITAFVAPLAFITAGFRPRWRDWLTAIAATVGWGLLVMAANAVVGSNYGYLNGAPAAATPLDYLGPWPYYLVVGLAGLAAVWALMTLPGLRGRSRPSTGVLSGR